MRLLVVRHAAAEDKDEFARAGRSDDLRPLTADGKRDMREAARGLRNVVPKLDLLATYARSKPPRSSARCTSASTSSSTS
jgi:phosphohistidine phosphatase